MFKSFNRWLVICVVLGICTCSTLAQIKPSSVPVEIRGQVRYANGGAPAYNVIVRLERFHGGLVAEVFTDRIGKFRFPGLTPGQYTVSVRASGFKEVKQDVDLETNTSDYVQLQLSPETLSSRQSVVNLAIDANTPTEAQTEFDKGRTAVLEDKQLEKGIPHLEKAIAIYPKFFEAHLLLGTAYMDLQQWDKAEKTLRAAISINSSAYTAYFALGEVYRREKKFSEAEKTLLDGIKLNEKSAEGHSTLAKVYWDMAPTAKDEQQFRKFLENSWQEISKSLQLNPNLVEAHLLAGNLLLRARRAKDALAHFEEYLKLEPKGEFAAQTQSMVQKIKQALSQPEKKN